MSVCGRVFGVCGCVGRVCVCVGACVGVCGRVCVWGGGVDVGMRGCGVWRCGWEKGGGGRPVHRLVLATSCIRAARGASVIDFAPPRPSLFLEQLSRKLAEEDYTSPAVLEPIHAQGLLEGRLLAQQEAVQSQPQDGTVDVVHLPKGGPQLCVKRLAVVPTGCSAEARACVCGSCDIPQNGSVSLPSQNANQQRF